MGPGGHAEDSAAHSEDATWERPALSHSLGKATTTSRSAACLAKRYRAARVKTGNLVWPKPHRRSLLSVSVLA